MAIPQGAVGSSTKEVQCSGTESLFSECTLLDHDECRFAISVLCYTSDLNGNRRCEGDSPTTTTLSNPSTTSSTTTLSDPATTATTTSATSTTTSPTTSGSTPPTTSETRLNTLGSSPFDPSSASSDILQPPVIYYIIGGVVAGTMLLMILAGITAATVCYWTIGRKRVNLPKQEPNYETIDSKPTSVNVIL